MYSRIEQLAEEAGQLLKKRNYSLVTVESCTGGWISQAITGIAGSSEWFDRGYVTYSNEAKRELGVSAASLELYGAVSKQVAQEMVLAGLKRSEADIAVSVTGIAGPDGGTTEKPVGTVWIAWGDKSNQVVAEHFQFSGDREVVRRESVESALTGVLEFLHKNG